MQVEDAHEVAALVRAAFGSIDVPLDPAPSALNETGESIRTQILSGGGAVWEQGGLLGCIVWRVHDGGLYVGRLAVATRGRGQGIAQRLLDEAAQEAMALEQPRLHLGTRLALLGNRRLFMRAGFLEIGLRTHDGYNVPTWVEMEKRLRPSGNDGQE